MRKLIDAVQIETGTPVLDEMTTRLLEDPRLVGLVVNVRQPDVPTRFSRRIWPEIDSIDAMVSRWYHADDASMIEAVGPLAADGLASHFTFAVDEHIGIERSRDWPDGEPSPGLKHISLLCSTVASDEFRLAYRHHVELVHIHLPTMWHYVQNDVTSAVGQRANEFAAISELSYRSVDDYEHRWAQGEASEIEFRSHEGFLDLPKTVTIMCNERILRTPPA